MLYNKDGNKITIKDGDERAYSLHGLGHLLNPFGKNVNWHKEVWEDILKLHYGIISQTEFIKKYSNFYAISKLSVSSKDIINRFKQFNNGKPYGNQIKPFNFFLIGVGNNKDVKPITSFSKEPQEAVHKPFIDYKSGDVMIGIEYWKPLSDVLLSYIDHKESKLEGTTGILERKHLNVSAFTYIGKEATNLGRTGTLDRPSYAEYTDQEAMNKRLLEITPKEAREEFRIRYRSTLKKMRDRIKNN